MKSKKGELLSGKTVGILLAVIVFVVVLGFWFASDLFADADKKICGQSVDYRASLPLGGGTNYPLKCKTEQVCIGGSDCEEFRSGKIKEEKLSGDEGKDRQKVLDILSEKLKDCHGQLGQGDKDFTPRTINPEKYCVICSRLVLDDEDKGSVDEDKGSVDEVSYIELYQYMMGKKLSDGTSYLEYVYDTKSVNDMVAILEEARKIANEHTSNKVSSVEDLTINLANEQAIIAGMISKDAWGQILGGSVLGAGLAIGGIIASPFSLGSSLGITAVGVSILTGGTVAGIVYASTSDNGKGYIYPNFYEYNLESLRSLQCYSFESLPN